MTDHCNVCVHIVQFWRVIKVEKRKEKRRKRIQIIASNSKRKEKKDEICIM